jgi:hypothetical protein
MVKRGSLPCLCLETRAIDLNVQHDIPIKVLKASNIAFLAPPNVLPPTVALELPRGRVLKTIIDRMSKLARTAVLRFEMAGRIVLAIGYASSSIKTFFTNMTPQFESGLNEELDGNNHATVKVRPNVSAHTNTTTYTHTHTHTKRS